MSAVPPAPVHVGHVTAAAQFTLRKWLWTYIGFAEDWYGYPPRSLPATHGPLITATADLEKWPENRLPFVMLYGGGVEGTPNCRGDAYDAQWLIQVAVIVGAPAVSEEATLKLAQTYGAAIRTCLTWQPLEGLPQGVEPNVRWMTEDPDLPVVINRRTMAAVRLGFLVSVSGVLQRQDLPRTPDPLPDLPDGSHPDYPDAPTVEQTNITVEPRES